MQLFFNSEITTDTQEVTFSKEESKHITKVLRKNNGDKLNITNGKGYLFTAEITLASLKNCTAKITETTFFEKRNFHLHLVVAPTKMNDRYEWFLEKATEIGVSEITPIICKNSERKVIKKERYEKIVLSAMKQSLHYYLPKLNDAISFNTFMQQHQGDNKYIAHCEETEKTLLKDCIQPDNDALILIGPEGDFTTDEITTALQNNFKAVSLGFNRLRTETAAIVACHTVNLIND